MSIWLTVLFWSWVSQPFFSVPGTKFEYYPESSLYRDAVNSCQAMTALLACPKNPVHTYFIAALKLRLTRKFFCRWISHLRYEIVHRCKDSFRNFFILKYLFSSDQHFNTNCFRGDAWIGFNDIKEEGNYECYDSDSVTYTNFGDDSPLNRVSISWHHNLSAPTNIF